MRRIAIINQKGGVGKTTTATNLGAALARAGKRVVVVDMDPQANLSLYLGCEARSGDPTIYGVLVGGLALKDALRATRTPGLWLVPSHIDLSGAELELAATIGRETVLRDALDTWEQAGAEVPDNTGTSGPIDYLLLDCPPSLGLLSINALASAYEVLISVQTEFFALQGLGKLVEVIQLMQRRLNPRLELTGLLPNLYDNRLRLAREVLAELRRFFPGKVYTSSVRSNVKLAESPSHSLTIFEYAPDSNGAKDYSSLAQEVILQEAECDVPAPATTDRSEELLAAAVALREIEAAKRAEALLQAPVAQEQVDSSEEAPGAVSAAPEPAGEPVEESEPSGIEIEVEFEAELEAELETEAETGQPEIGTAAQSASEEPQEAAGEADWTDQDLEDGAVLIPAAGGIAEEPKDIASSYHEQEESGPEAEVSAETPNDDPLVHLEAAPAANEPLPFGVVIPPGPNSRVEFRAAGAPNGGTAVLEHNEHQDQAEAEVVGDIALDELEEDWIEEELDELADPASSARSPEVGQDPQTEPFEPVEVVTAAEAPRATPVYGFGHYIGEDRSRPPGPAGPATARA